MSVIIRNSEGLDDSPNLSAAYRVIWRWHFYAGLFSTPFIVVLALSGAVFLFKPQIDAFLDRPYDHLTLSSAPKTLDEQVEAAQAAMPDARLAALELRGDRADAARVSFLRQSAEGEFQEYRVLVRPDTLEILKTENEKSSPVEHCRKHPQRSAARVLRPHRDGARRGLGHRHDRHWALPLVAARLVRARRRSLSAALCPRPPGLARSTRRHRRLDFLLRDVSAADRAALDDSLGRELPLCAQHRRTDAHSSGLDHGTGLQAGEGEGKIRGGTTGSGRRPTRTASSRAGRRDCRLADHRLRSNRAFRRRARTRRSGLYRAAVAREVRTGASIR